MRTRTCTAMRPPLVDSVKSIIPRGEGDVEVYQFPEGTAVASDHELEDIIEAKGLATLTKINRAEFLTAIAPWGYIPRQLHFVLVPLNNVEDESGELGGSYDKTTKFSDREVDVPSSTSRDVVSAFGQFRTVYQLLWKTKRPITMQQDAVRYLDPQLTVSKTNPVMIRDEYDDLWKEILSMLASTSHGRESDGMVILGQPGIGE
ncbi:hypothetical protein L226DRAFT_223004 [Lentinus tigrinus ALCF2SS1-7]|uniref:uncharacterized protein n=1 Tax=Lentinus tigrinus ALCF2SS1-7 TaxID=1328758 RepID=UPI001165CE91|nr:hypothetical protein L226DRAFT_223004 [Lentinus tigrinus ALCF2SS1-7]